MGRPRKMKVGVIDLFAGPGGLGEGFSSFKHDEEQSPYQIALSIEKDPIARKTLMLRSFFRQFETGKCPEDFYSYLRKDISRESLFEAWPEQSANADLEAWQVELGKEPHWRVKGRVAHALSQFQERDRWALIGGPPCQAYSMVGRSRMKTVDAEKFEADERHFLYREYLRIIADHRPPVFVMENVKGILSSKVKGKGIFHQILKDLEYPHKSLERVSAGSGGTLKYRLLPIVHTDGDLPGLASPSSFLVRSEQFGIPQKRHRVFVLGLRADLYDVNYSGHPLEEADRESCVNEWLHDLPAVRSEVSHRSKNGKERPSLELVLNSGISAKWFTELDESIRNRMTLGMNELFRGDFEEGGQFVPKGQRRPKTAVKNWAYDAEVGGYCNHEPRTHMAEDFLRYLFASSYAKEHRISPKLKDFPKELLPKHKNISETGEQTIFDDRFRVQVAGDPSTTITSHISKDGHYYIHPDPSQCRSLTVREAARLQTFPDNYFFEGPRTEQYRQVGNAVPPLLAKQIAEMVFKVLKDAD